MLAYNGVGNSSYSNTATVTTPASTASNPDPNTPPVSAWPLSATAGAGEVTLSWIDNSNNETGFRIDRATDGVNFSQVATLGANVTSWIDTSVGGGATYTYRIRAYNDAGYSYWSNLASATPTGGSSSGQSPAGDSTVPPASAWPLQATSEQNDILLTWTDNSNNEAYFLIDRSTDGVNFTQVATVVADSTRWADPNVVSGVTYTYRIKACNDAGSSNWSNIVNATLA